MAEKRWEIACTGEALKRCRRDPKFVYIVTLARATNALNSVTSVLNYVRDKDSPASRRDLWNSFFFASAVLYESLQLVRKMNQAFADDKTFQDSLRLLLKDKVARRIENENLGPARNGAIFHFDPEWFGKNVAAADFRTCVFLTAEGGRNTDVFYGFSDEITLEILIGTLLETDGFEKVLLETVRETTDLAIRFSQASENLIATNLLKWGFVIRDQSPSGMSKSSI